MDIQSSQHHAQTHIALFKVGNSSHDLLVSRGTTCLLQLNGQICQLLGMGGIVADHILHEGYQLIHGGVLALGCAATTAATAIVAVVVMVMIMGVVVAMQMVMLMGMGVVMLMSMDMVMGVCVTVMGMLVRMGMLMGMIVAAAAAVMIVVMMFVHSDRSLPFFLYYTEKDKPCQ